MEIDEDESIDEDTHFGEVGLTSITLVELVEALEKAFHTKLPETILFEHTTIGGISGYIAGLQGQGGPDEAAPAQPVSYEPESGGPVPLGQSDDTPENPIVPDRADDDLDAILARVFNGNMDVQTAQSAIDHLEDDERDH